MTTFEILELRAKTTFGNLARQRPTRLRDFTETPFVYVNQARTVDLLSIAEILDKIEACEDEQDVEGVTKICEELEVTSSRRHLFT